MSYSDLITAIESALSDITLVNGYRTDAGQRVWRGVEYQSEPPTKPCIIYYPGEVGSSVDGDPPPSLGEQSHRLPVQIEAYIDDDATAAAAEDLRHDLVAALHKDPFFGGLCDGIESVSSSARAERGGQGGYLGVVEVDLTITYTTLYGDF
jgi:hypothetical protein